MFDGAWKFQLLYAGDALAAALCNIAHSPQPYDNHTPRPSEYMGVFNDVMEATHSHLINPLRPIMGLWDKKVRHGCSTGTAAGVLTGPSPLLVPRSAAGYNAQHAGIWVLTPFPSTIQTNR